MKEYRRAGTVALFLLNFGTDASVQLHVLVPLSYRNKIRYPFTRWNGEPQSLAGRF